MNENERKVVVRRMLLLIAVACTIMGLYTFRLIFLQLVNGDDFKAKATNTTDYKFTVTAARGDIVDSTGKHIATTSTGYNVVLNKPRAPAQRAGYRPAHSCGCWSPRSPRPAA